MSSRAATQTGTQVAQANLTPPAAPPQYIPQPRMVPPQQYKLPPRRWLPGAAIVAAILLAGAMIAGAILLTGNENGSGTTLSPSSTQAALPNAPINAATTGTCVAWADTKKDLDLVPPMPSGWQTDPNRDVYIGNQVRVLTPVLDAFERKISPEPQYLAEAARAYIAKQRGAMVSAKNGTYVSGQTDRINAAYDKLDALCTPS
ncbi:hypothetical protein [Mycobacteroides abscessus]|uniref:hypothetical protein n=1 Tax=Mycobacteroides abscessus TaxID=36809 RepID=UPI0009A860E1|nr:hypothetical protein [Mycobacteroides abscessus]